MHAQYNLRVLYDNPYFFTYSNELIFFQKMLV
jgi:hypothetical protein